MINSEHLCVCVYEFKTWGFDGNANNKPKEALL